MLPKNALTALFLPNMFSLASNAIKCFKWWKKLKINRQIKREIKFIERIQKIYAKWSKKYLREKEKRIQNPHERLWKKSKSIQREDLSSILFNLDQEILQSLPEVLNQRSSSSQAFVQAFIHLEKIQKGFLHLSKVFYCYILSFKELLLY